MKRSDNVNLGDMKVREKPDTLISSLKKLNLRSYTMILALLVIWGILTIMTDGTFLTPRNMSNLFRQGSVVAFIAIGMVLVVAAGQIDLSVGSLAGLTGAIVALLQVRWLPSLAEATGMTWIASGWPSTIIAVLFAIVFGMLLGAWQGLWIAYGRVPAFIVTLGGLLIFRGSILGLTRGVNIAPLDPTLQLFGQAYLSPMVGAVLGGLAVVAILVFGYYSRMNKRKYGFPVRSLSHDVLIILVSCAATILFVVQMNRFRGIPVPVVILLCLTGLFTFIANRTQFGRHTFAIGGNIEAARLSGINIRRTMLWIYTVMGGLAGISGVVLTARLNVATANAGNLFELNAIAACVIGGTSLAGGEGSIPGAIIGSLIMASIDNGMSLMNVESFWQQIVKGFILMIAVLVDVNSRKVND